VRGQLASRGLVACRLFRTSLALARHAPQLTTRQGELSVRDAGEAVADLSTQPKPRHAARMSVRQPPVNCRILCLFSTELILQYPRLQNSNADEEHDPEYQQTDYYRPSGVPPARQSSHLDLQVLSAAADETY